MLFGAQTMVGGTIKVNGRPVRLRSPRDAIRRGVGLALVPEDRKTEGLLLAMSMRHNLTLAVLRRISRLGILRPRPGAQAGADHRRTSSGAHAGPRGPGRCAQRRQPAEGADRPLAPGASRTSCCSTTSPAASTSPPSTSSTSSSAAGPPGSLDPALLERRRGAGPSLPPRAGAARGPDRGRDHAARHHRRADRGRRRARLRRKLDHARHDAPAALEPSPGAEHRPGAGRPAPGRQPGRLLLDLLWRAAAASRAASR